MKSAGYLAIVGGILLVIGGATGTLIFGTIKEFVTPYLEGDSLVTVSLVLNILIILAALGGLLVIGGGYAIMKEHERVGKVLIFIGLGTGLFSLIIQLLVAVATGTFDAFTGSMMTFTGIGSVLAIVASKLA